MGNDGLCCRCGEIEPHGMDCHCPTEPCFALVQPAPSRCPVCGYIAGAVPSDFRAFAWANCERRDSHDKPAPAPAPLCGGDEVNGCAYHCSDPECAQSQPAPAPLPEKCPLCNGSMRIMEPFEHPCTCDPKWQLSPESVSQERDRLRVEIFDLTRRLAVLENPVTFFCVHCRENFPATSDGLKAGMEHDLTCKSNPLVRRLAEAEAEWEKRRRRYINAYQDMDEILTCGLRKQIKMSRKIIDLRARVRELEALVKCCRPYVSHLAPDDLEAALAATEVK